MGSPNGAPSVVGVETPHGRGRFVVVGERSGERVWPEYQVAEQIDGPGDLAPYDAILAAAVAKDPAWARARRAVPS